MRFWFHVIHRAWSDTVGYFLQGGYMTGVAIFLISLFVVLIIRGRYAAKELWFDGKIGALATTIYFALYFVAHIVLFSPSEIYREQNSVITNQVAEIETLTNVLQNLKDANSDLFASNRPQLDPVLIIDSVSSNSVAYHFEVNNLGKITGADITFYEKREDYQGGDLGANYGYGSWHLAAGATMTINTIKPKPLLPSDYGFSTDLILDYRLITRGLTTNFTTLFRYAIPMSSLHTGRFFYISMLDETDSNKLTKPLKQEALQKQIERPQGSVGIVLSGQKVAWIQSEHRRIIYDPVNKFAEFDNKNSDGTIAIIKINLIYTENEYHIIFVSWRTNFAMLSADNPSNAVTWSR